MYFSTMLIDSVTGMVGLHGGCAMARPIGMRLRKGVGWIMTKGRQGGL
jgi:hypothetical protein